MVKLVPCGTDGRLLLSGFQALVTWPWPYRVIWHITVHASTTICIPNFTEIGKTCFCTD